MKKAIFFGLAAIVIVSTAMQCTGRRTTLQNVPPAPSQTQTATPTPTSSNNPALDTVPSYKKNPSVPPFKIMQPDSTWVTNASLPKNKPLVIIYFSPECGHCQLAAKEISNSYEQLKGATFLWVSYYSVPEIKTFVENYNLAQYKNFLFGRDPQYFLPSYFKVRFTPFMAVYDNNGQFVQAFEQGASPEVLATLIHDNLNNKKPKKRS